jgi:hypothetical protein
MKLKKVEEFRRKCTATVPSNNPAGESVEFIARFKLAEKTELEALVDEGTPNSQVCERYLLGVTSADGKPVELDGQQLTEEQARDLVRDTPWLAGAAAGEFMRAHFGAAEQGNSKKPRRF